MANAPLNELDDLEIVPGIVVKESAYNFAAALAESQQFKNYEQATLRYRQDEAAQKDMQAYRNKQQELHPLMRINKVSQSDQALLEHLYNTWIAHDTVLEYLQAQSELAAFCQSLGDILSETVGFDFPNACAASCCG